VENGNRKEIADSLSTDGWIVACLCAAWCDACRQYRATFERLAQRHPDVSFLWIDIEDDADLVGDIDVDDFPTLLMQRGDIVAFFGPVLPDIHVADRLMAAHMQKTDEQLRVEAQASAERRAWQQQCNLLRRLRNA
jgi:thiol-disulfide isomerase/thioredoxin